MVLLRSTLCSLIFRVLDLCISDGRVLKSPTTIVDWSVCPCSSVSYCLPYSYSIVKRTSVKDCYNFLAVKFVMCEINIATPTFLWLLLAWYTSLHPLTFNLYVSLYFFTFIYFWETEWDKVWAGEGQRAKETQNLKQAPGSEQAVSTEPDAGLKPRSYEIMNRSQMLNWLSHPGAPVLVNFRLSILK